MKSSYTRLLCLLIASFLFICFNTKAQVGIGTTNPDASAMLDVESSSKGVLAPRMTTAEKNAIVSPATSLLVFDTDLGNFSYFNGTAWVELEVANGRDNYTLVKSISDLPTPSGGVITLNSGWVYEVNGAITIPYSINLNGAEIYGYDHEEDQLIYSGTGNFIISTEGGALERLTIATTSAAGKTLFDLSDATKSKVIKIRDSYVIGWGSIGTISGHFIVYMDLLGFMNNLDGITYDSVEDLFIMKQLWFSSNSGTYITLQGTFDDVTINGGLFEVSSGSVGLDVTSTPTIETTAHASGGITFAGAGTYVLPIATATSPSFTKKWEVEGAGIITEKDETATGAIYINTPATTTISAQNIPTKVNGATTATNLFRFDTNGQSNRLRYIGTKTRFFQINVTFSLQGGKNDIYAFYIYKNGVRVPSIYVLNKISNNDVGAASMTGTVEMATNDYLELWVEDLNDNGDCEINAMNFIVK
jgi:hypothetical protein